MLLKAMIEQTCSYESEKTMRRISALTLVLFFIFSGQVAYASSCGFAPVHNIIIPNGAVASRGDIETAVQAVQDFALKTTQHLNCLDAERETMFLNMNKDQQTRWVEDYDSKTLALAELQNKLNENIRLYNNTNK